MGFFCHKTYLPPNIEKNKNKKKNKKKKKKKTFFD